jgi:hypothetical protein
MRKKVLFDYHESIGILRLLLTGEFSSMISAFRFFGKVFLVNKSS